MWETKFLGHLRLQDLKDAILNSPYADDDEDAAEANAEFIHSLDD